MIQWKENINESKFLFQYERELDETSEDSEALEQRRLKSLPHGIGLCDYEVHFKLNDMLKIIHLLNSINRELKMVKEWQRLILGVWVVPGLHFSIIIV